MERVLLKELHFTSRAQALSFLKGLWNGSPTPCPFCGNTITPLHKKDTTDFACKSCDKAFKTIHLLDELNEAMKD